MTSRVAYGATVDLALVYPLFDNVFFTEPVGILALSAFLRERGFGVVVDGGFLDGDSMETTAKRLVELRPRILGVSMNAAREVSDGLELVRKVRALGYGGRVVVGGDFATARKDEVLATRDIDAVVLGEGEESLAELTRTWLAGDSGDSLLGVATWANSCPDLRRGARRLDDLPLLDRSIFAGMIERNSGSLRGLQASIPTSRGCYASCAFCSISTGTSANPGARFRQFSIERVVAEMVQLNAEFAVNEFYFCSAQFLPPGRATAERRVSELRHRVERLPFRPSIFLYLRCDNVTAAVARDLAAAGVTTVFIGVESFHAKSLEMMGKGLEPAEIVEALECLAAAGYSCDYRSPLRMKLGFIMFTPWIDLDGLEANLRECMRFRLPPKKMVYAMQLHDVAAVPDVGGDAYSAPVSFARTDDQIRFVRTGYLAVLGRLTGALEAIRAYQKADIDLPLALGGVTWQVVDAINDHAYAAFGRLIAAARAGDVAAIDVLTREASDLVDSLEIPRITGDLHAATPSGRLGCVESHLQRGLDNPQLWADDPDQAVAMTGRFP